MPFERIEMVMGDTATTPDQWLTASNLTIFQGGSELRRAAASARRALVERAAQRLGVPADALIVDDGVVRVKSSPGSALRYGELIGDGLKLQVDPKIALKNKLGVPAHRQVHPARRHSRQSHGRVHLYPRCARARHAACARHPARSPRRPDRRGRRLGGSQGQRFRADGTQAQLPRRGGTLRMGSDQGSARSTGVLGPGDRCPTRPACSITGAGCPWPRKS